MSRELRRDIQVSAAPKLKDEIQKHITEYVRQAECTQKAIRAHCVQMVQSEKHPHQDPVQLGPSTLPACRANDLKSRPLRLSMENAIFSVFQVLIGHFDNLQMHF